MRTLLAVLIGLALGLSTTLAFACNDPAYDTHMTPPPQVQLPPQDSQT